MAVCNIRKPMAICSQDGNMSLKQNPKSKRHHAYNAKSYIFRVWNIFLPVCNDLYKRNTGHLHGPQCLLFGITPYPENI